MFVKIDPKGSILALVTCEKAVAHHYPDYIRVDAESANWNDHYVSGGQVLPRPDPESTPSLSATSIPADGSTLLTVIGIPAGARVQVSGPVEDEWVEESGSCELSVDIPGLYTLKVEKWPQKAVEVSFHAT